MTVAHKPQEPVRSESQSLRLAVDVIRSLAAGKYETPIPEQKEGQLKELFAALKTLAADLVSRREEITRLNQITAEINSGWLLDEILDMVYTSFKGLVPFNRIGFSLIENEGKTVRAIWAKSDRPITGLKKDYSSDLKGSSLEQIIANGEPRVLNDLVEYLKEKPGSESTRLVVNEGMRASLTCPLISNGKPIGFMFFSSVHPHIYSIEHISTFQYIASQLAVIVEKGRLVSELNGQKNQISKQNAELARLSELRNTFLGMAAHDLRNPLSNILMISSLLTSDNQDLTVEASMDLVNEIHQQAEYMLNLLTDVLDVTQIESGKLDLNPILVDTRSLLEASIIRHNQLAEPKGSKIILEDVPDGRMFADRLRVRQVLDNLLSNAVKYSPPNSVIHVRAFHEPTAWRVEIQDQGPGIKDQDRHKLFTDFGKLSARPTGGEKSIGLGLAIVKRVIDAHKGKLGVESTSQGSTFWFSLPDMTEN